MDFVWQTKKRLCLEVTNLENIINGSTGEATYYGMLARDRSTTYLHLGNMRKNLDFELVTSCGQIYQTFSYIKELYLFDPY